MIALIKTSWDSSAYNSLLTVTLPFTRCAEARHLHTTRLSVARFINFGSETNKARVFCTCCFLSDPNRLVMRPKFVECAVTSSDD